MNEINLGKEPVKEPVPKSRCLTLTYQDIDG